jgi:hypothetical protein
MPEDLIGPCLLTPGGMLVLGGAPKSASRMSPISLLVHAAASAPFLRFTAPRALRLFYLQAEIRYHYRASGFSSFASSPKSSPARERLVSPPSSACSSTSRRPPGRRGGPRSLSRRGAGGDLQRPDPQPLRRRCQRRGRERQCCAVSCAADLLVRGHEVPYEGVPVATIARFATGKGNAPKEVVIAAMRARGFASADDNKADALALLLWLTDGQKGRA